MFCLSYLVSLKLVLVIFGFFKRPVSSVSQLSKYIQENICICSCAKLVTSVNKHTIHKHCRKNGTEFTNGDKASMESINWDQVASWINLSLNWPGMRTTNHQFSSRWKTDKLTFQTEGVCCADDKKYSGDSLGCSDLHMPMPKWRIYRDLRKTDFRAKTVLAPTPFPGLFSLTWERGCAGSSGNSHFGE